MINIVRSAQKVSSKNSREEYSDLIDSTSEMVILKPEGYPLTSILDEFPQIENQKVFEHYAREQWNGFLALKGEYLFDRRMYPDFAYRIIDVKPEETIIGSNTKIIVETDNSITQKVDLKTKVTFEEFIGQKRAREKCKLIERFLQEPTRFGKWAPRNILFHGPSGTGKTMLAKALANKVDVPIIPIKATQMIGEYVGEGSRQIHQLYERAEEMAPCIIFIDELDAIALNRKYQELRGDVAEIVNALLTEMDGIVEREGVCTIGATNHTDVLDPAVRSRFEEEIEFTLPEENERIEIIRSNIDTFPIPVKEFDIERIAKLTKGCSGRDIVEKVLKPALHKAIIGDRDEVIGEYFEEVLKNLNRTSSNAEPDRMFI